MADAGATAGPNLCCTSLQAAAHAAAAANSVSGAVHAAAFQHRAGAGTEAVHDLVLVAYRAAAAAADASPSEPHALHVAAAAHAVSQAVAAAGSGRAHDAALAAGRAATAVDRAAKTTLAHLPPGTSRFLAARAQVLVPDSPLPSACLIAHAVPITQSGREMASCPGRRCGARTSSM